MSIIYPSILVGNGRYFDLNNPEAAVYTINVIASSLSKMCRFTGHCNRFYSVAEHSVYVSRLCGKKHAMEGLLHDAHEAFVGDVSSPLKTLLPDYKNLEKRVESAVRKRFGLPEHKSDDVSRADLVALGKESDELLPPHDKWEVLAGLDMPLGTPDLGLSPEDAYNLFMDRYEELTNA